MALALPRPPSAHAAPRAVMPQARLVGLRQRQRSPADSVPGTNSSELRSGSPLGISGGQSPQQGESLLRMVEELRTLVKLMRVELAQERTARERLEKEVAAIKARIGTTGAT